MHVHYDGLSRPLGGWITSQRCTDILAITHYTHHYPCCRNCSRPLGRLLHWLSPSSDQHSYKTRYELWVWSYGRRFCHLLHPGKTSVPVCSEVWDLGYNGIGMQWVFFIYTYLIYNLNIYVHDNSAPINQIIDILTASITGNDCKLCCLSITSIPYMLDMNLLKMASWAIKSCFSRILAPISYCPFHKGINLRQSLLDI